MLCLALRVHVDVHGKARLEPGPPGQERAREIQGDAVDVDPQQLAEPDVPVGHERQRCKEVLAELPVCHPGIPFPVTFEREGIDEERSPLVELDVVGTGILEGHPVLQRDPLDIQGDQCSFFELAKRPLVGIRDEGYLFGLDDDVRIFRLFRRDI